MKTNNKSEKTPKQQLIDLLRRQGAVDGLDNVFTTFLELTALSTSILFDPTTRSERRQRMEELQSRQTAEQLTEYTEMTRLIGLAVEAEMDTPCDILGSVFHELKLHNEWRGQFFTPDYICRLMAQLVNCSDSSQDLRIFNEPTCGSGAMVLGAAYAMRQKGQDTQNVLWIAQDIDIRCVWMAYIQLTLFKIPAVVIHGNSLTGEEWSRWYTPYISCGCERTDVYADMPPHREAVSV